MKIGREINQLLDGTMDYIRKHGVINEEERSKLTTIANRAVDQIDKLLNMLEMEPETPSYEVEDIAGGRRRGRRHLSRRRSRSRSRKSRS